jgi:hypothetical protein
MGLILIGFLFAIQNTNGFIFCTQFCNYNRGVIMAVGGTEAKFFNA